MPHHLKVRVITDAWTLWQCTRGCVPVFYPIDFVCYDVSGGAPLFLRKVFDGPGLWPSHSQSYPLRSPLVLPRDPDLSLR
jgi:hypothetical protein